MKSYKIIYKIASVMIAIPLLWILVLNILKFNVIVIMVVVGLLFALWKSNQLLKLETKNAFTISSVFATILWIMPAYQIIRRVNFILENGGMERADGYGSPMAFLIGFISELYFFIPLSIVLIAAMIYYLKSNKTS